MPTIMIATIRSEVPTGRSMKIRDGFMSRPRLLVGLRGRPVCAATPLAACPLSFTLAAPLPVVRRRGALAVGRRRGDRRTGCARRAAGAADLGAVAQAVDAIHHHLVADLEALGDGDLLAVGRTGL